MPEQPEKKDIPAEETSSSGDDEKREERRRNLEILDEIEEWKRLKGLATKPRIREVIDGEILRLQILQNEDQIVEKKKFNLEQRPVMIQVPPSPAPVKIASGSPTAPEVHFLPITSFAWDQTDTAVKVYVKLQNVQKVPKENISATFTTQSLDLEVKELEGKNYKLSFRRLSHPIDPKGSSYKAKKDMVVLTLQKAGRSWWYELPFKENKFASTPKMDSSGDPGASIMSLMKNLYEEGDDEMKRTIAKSWTESQQKKLAGESPFDDMAF
ncbi:calcyclin-binding protein [Cystoisospora suis]|uniref:Calcyclin-binding protein n=1 Tax=Cystoisospora suis TaxID=483139 RepID=A0A2C6LDR2_9APIC|nr:calcyclin-binding protein [Cystoisospora suis]